MTKKIQLDKTWTLHEEIGGGGFGKVYRATCDDEVCAAKLVPKDPGADRELLFVDLADAENVVPILEKGEDEDSWVLIMPLADHSLRQEIEDSGGQLTQAAASDITADVVKALISLDGKVVHRDLKPENVLFFNGRWCLSDFGISRYAEETTAPDTRKHALSPPYAAPERWRNERAGSASDVYSLGVMLHEMIAGGLPFPGPTTEQFRDQHLHGDYPRIEGVPDSLASLVEECMYRSAEARPGPTNIAARLERVSEEAVSSGRASLEAANRAAVEQRREEDRLASQARSSAERRSDLAQAGETSFGRISASLRDFITGAAPAASVSNRGAEWSISLGGATLGLESPSRVAPDSLAEFDVVLASTLDLRLPADEFGNEGRSHSLWFSDAQTAGRFAWFETAFMIMPLMNERSTQEPFALPPGSEAEQALGTGMSTRQVAWTFTQLDVGDLGDFLNRWAEWFGKAAAGQLARATSMPEGNPGGSWRRG